jgi:hypothetical protein
LANSVKDVFETCTIWNGVLPPAASATRVCGRLSEVSRLSIFRWPPEQARISVVRNCSSGKLLEIVVISVGRAGSGRPQPGAARAEAAKAAVPVSPSRAPSGARSSLSCLVSLPDLVAEPAARVDSALAALYCIRMQSRSIASSGALCRHRS